MKGTYPQPHLLHLTAGKKELVTIGLILDLSANGSAPTNFVLQVVYKI